MSRAMRNKYLRDFKKKIEETVAEYERGLDTADASSQKPILGTAREMRTGLNEAKELTLAAIERLLKL